MCRNIQTLRPPFVEHVTDEDVRAAALQYVRKIAGMRAPSAANAETFDHAVDAVAAATAQLLDSLVLRPSTSKHAKPHANATAHHTKQIDDAIEAVGQPGEESAELRRTANARLAEASDEW